MSLAYCFDCLERIDECKCGNPSNQIIYGKYEVIREQTKRESLIEKEKE